MDNQKPRSHVRLALSMVLVVVISAGLIGAAYLLTNSTTSQSTLTRSPAPCVSSYPQSAVNRTTLSNGTEVTHVTSPALVMSPGSTMSVCVYYGGSSDASYSIPASSSISAWGPGGQQLQPAQNLNVTASPALISIPPGQSTVIEYTVTAGQGSTGFYSLSMAEACGQVPVAVGDEPSRVNASDFPGSFGSYFCPGQTLYSTIVGYTGASIAYLTNESRLNLQDNITGVSVSSFPTSQGAETVTFRMSVQSFSYPLTVGLSLSQSNLRVDGGNPDSNMGPPNDYCSWNPTNSSALFDESFSTFQEGLNSSLRVDAPTLQLGAYSSATYTVSILIMPPIARNVAIYPTLYTEVPGGTQGYGGLANSFPVSISGQLQSISGSCSPGI
jgi:hypothetical protein